MAAFVFCVLGSMDLTVGKIAAWVRTRREAQYIPDEDVPLAEDEEDEPEPQPLPEPRRSARRAVPDKPVAKKKIHRHSGRGDHDGAGRRSDRPDPGQKACPRREKGRA